MSQTKYVVMMTKEGSTTIVNFMTLWGKGTCAGA